MEEAEEFVSLDAFLAYLELVARTSMLKVIAVELCLSPPTQDNSTTSQDHDDVHSDSLRLNKRRYIS